MSLYILWAICNDSIVRAIIDIDGTRREIQNFNDSASGRHNWDYYDIAKIGIIDEHTLYIAVRKREEE